MARTGAISLQAKFKIEDVIQCFALKSNASARSRVARLIKDGLVAKAEEYVENGTTKAVYKKTGKIMN